MKRSEKLYGCAVGLIFAVSASADSPNYVVWSAVAVVCVLGATFLVWAGRRAERRGK